MFFEEIISSFDYVNKLIKIYKFLDNDNINAKLTILYCIYKFIESMQEKPLQHPRGKILEQLFKYTALNLQIAFKELIIAEHAITIILYEIGAIKNDTNS